MKIIIRHTFLIRFPRIDVSHIKIIGKSYIKHKLYNFQEFFCPDCNKVHKKFERFDTIKEIN